MGKRTAEVVEDVSEIEAILAEETLADDAVVEEVSDDEIEGALSDDDRAAAYAEQESEVEVASEEEVAEKTVKAKKGAKKAKKAAAASSTSEPKERKPRITFSSPSEHIKALLGGEALVLNSETPTDEAAFYATVDTLAKKVKEKATNAFEAALKGKKLSNYTKIAVDMLKASETVTSKDILETMRASYSEGTARAQSQQMMVLLPALGIATRDKSTLTRIDTSVLLDALTSAPATE